MSEFIKIGSVTIRADELKWIEMGEDDTCIVVLMDGTNLRSTAKYEDVNLLGAKTDVRNFVKYIGNPNVYSRLRDGKDIAYAVSIIADQFLSEMGDK